MLTFKIVPPKVLAILLLLFTVTFYGQTKDLPNIVILATGGTIAGSAESETEAGYESGQVGVDVLINAVPQLKDIAIVTGEQISNIGSQNMNDEVWLKLAKRCNKLLAKDDVDGIVITHGTDTMEETSYFLNLVIHSTKPVVLTGSMRPATALSADGPLNIYNAVAVAADSNSHGLGVLVVANDMIHSARTVIKTNTTSVETFLSPFRGHIGTVHYGKINYFRKPHKKHTYQSEFYVDDLTELPRVDIIYIHENVDGSLINCSVNSGAEGIITAGVGNGNLTDAAIDALKNAAQNGVVCVRSTRVPTGYVGRNIEIDDDAMGFAASYELGAPKARVLLRLALLKTKDPKEIQRIFATY